MTIATVIAELIGAASKLALDSSISSSFRAHLGELKIAADNEVVRLQSLLTHSKEEENKRLEDGIREASKGD